MLSDSICRVNTLAALKEVPISAHTLEQMLAFARLMFRLKRYPAYIQALSDKLPSTADAMHDEASILMGFDFHLTDHGPKLIEINNNAGGLHIGQNQWLPQPKIEAFSQPLETRLLHMFPPSWQTIAIMDEDIETQYMYPEMQHYADLLRSDGRVVFLVSPKDIEARSDGLYVQNKRLDGIYNRHTDFYLDSEALVHLRSALMQGQIALNPHPRSYALLGDKARMVDWWHHGLLEHCLSDDELALVRQVVPEIHLLSECDLEQIWKGRKQWVFKPTARHGGKGVLLGKSMSRKRFDALDLNTTVVQAYVPASQISDGDRAYKLDIRLYMHGESLIALAARLWRGQVTNFREQGSGWAALHIES